MSFIHIDDAVGLLLHAARTDAIHGPMNGVAPHPVTNAEFTETLGALLRRPTVLAVPRAALRLALGEMSEILLGSHRVVPRVALDTGYAFIHPGLHAALSAAIDADARSEAA
jgi:NAD dependent epimerase/dehydratase family enzyme